MRTTNNNHQRLNLVLCSLFYVLALVPMYIGSRNKDRPKSVFLNVTLPDIGINDISTYLNCTSPRIDDDSLNCLYSAVHINLPLPFLAFLTISLASFTWVLCAAAGEPGPLFFQTAPLRDKIRFYFLHTFITSMAVICSGLLYSRGSNGRFINIQATESNLPSVANLPEDLCESILHLRNYGAHDKDDDVRNLFYSKICEEWFSCYIKLEPAFFITCFLTLIAHLVLYF